MFGRRPTGKRSNPEATRFFFAWRKHPWNYANLQRDSFLRFASSAKAPRPARICAYLQSVGKQYRLYGGEGGIRTPETLSSLHAFQACALNRARPPLRTRTRLCITPTRGASSSIYKVRPRHARAVGSNQNAGLKAPATAERVARTDELNPNGGAALLVIAGRLLRRCRVRRYGASQTRLIAPHRPD